MFNPRKNIRELGLGRYVARCLSSLGLSRNASFLIAKIVKTVVSPKVYVKSRSINTYTAKKTVNLQISKSDHYLPIAKDTIPEINELIVSINKFHKEYFNDFHAAESDHYRYFINPLRPGTEENLGEHEKLLVRKILKLASHPELMALASEYIGSIPVMHGYSLNHVGVHANGDTLRGAQLFHRDVGESKLLHFLVMVKEVTEENGPFCFLPGDISEKITEKLKHQNGRVQDEVIYDIVEPSELLKFKGEPGQALFLNPCKCWHYGARTKGQDRISMIISYAPFNAGVEGTTSFTLERYRNWLATEELSQAEKHLLRIY